MGRARKRNFSFLTWPCAWPPAVHHCFGKQTMEDRLRRYGKLFTQPVALFKPRRYILILSHMRARTTLLSHVLGSHENVCGYKELHCSYSSSIDVLRMKAALVDETRFGSADFLLDKLLHNRLQICSKIFEPDQILPIFVLREPKGSMSSMMQMHHDINRSNQFDHLYAYYVERLDRLAELAAIWGSRALYIESDSIVNSTDKVLSATTDFLGLSSPLSKEYQTFSGTGRAGMGDPGKNIHAGVILNHTPSAARMTIPPDALTRAHQKYQALHSVLSQTCQVVAVG